MIRTLADRVILADGWARAVIAVLGGAVGALAMPPFGFWPALIVSLAVAVWLIDGSDTGSRHPVLATLRRAAFGGWFWGFGYFVAGLWWIGSAFLVEADVFAWLLPFGVLGLPALLAVFPALGFAIARTIWSRRAGRLFALAFGLTLSEWLRGHLFTGFPWNTLGLALAQGEWPMQAASVIGMWGLTVVAILSLAAPATIATGETTAQRALPTAIAALALACIAAFGAARLNGAAPSFVPGVMLRIMQPNLTQDVKFSAANGPAILQKYLDLSDRATSPEASGLQTVTHLIWPESAFPFLLHREPNALAQIASTLPKGSVLVTGAARLGETPPGETARRFYNAIQAVGSDGAIVATYDKVHLVPFGEYVPHILDATLRAVGIRQFVTIPGGFTAGERHTLFRVPGLPPAAAAICYEAIFPDEVVPDGPRPGLLLNVTNDGWFGRTPGPYQHFAQARLRAVETGLPLVRAANTGISAVVDPYGRIVASLPLGSENVLDSRLPAALPDTLHRRYGDITLALLCILCGGFAVAARTWSR